MKTLTGLTWIGKYIMPDISMCDSVTCPLRNTCHRNPCSGTQPSEFRQSWFIPTKELEEDCKYYWPVKEKQNDS